ncbi:MAG: redox-sensing transcriptional repressor Rex [Candidatus Muiribacteriota bacterium]|jgi:redox-sensing transcriptional repressor
MEEKTISNKTIERLSIYLRYLTYLQIEGKEKVDSKELSKLALVSPCLLRKDLSYFGEFGRSGYGYNIIHLKNAIEKILQTDSSKNFIIIGAGNIGKALANYVYFDKLNFHLKAIFDNNLKKVGKKIGNLNIRSYSELETYLDKNNIHIAIIATPKESAREVYLKLTEKIVQGIWNFAPVDFPSTKHSYVINEHLSKNMLVLSYHNNKMS